MASGELSPHLEAGASPKLPVAYEIRLWAGVVSALAQMAGLASNLTQNKTIPLCFFGDLLSGQCHP
jgi:hypothetical protein